MKRIVKIALILIIIFLIPAGILHAQEKKNERHIKVIVADKSGTKVEIDTLIKGDISADSIKLKSGEVIFLAKDGAVGTIKHMEGEKGQMFVTVTSDDKDNKADKKRRKEITVISGDSDHIIQGGEGDEVVIIKNGKHFKEGKGGDVVSWSSSSSTGSSSSSSVSSSKGDSKSRRVIYFNEGKKVKKDGEKTFDVRVSTDGKGNTIEKTKYVIAKDGMVVSIEGNDEAKVKDLVKEVESKLGVSKDDQNMKQVAKEEAGKPTKK